MKIEIKINFDFKVSQIMIIEIKVRTYMSSLIARTASATALISVIFSVGFVGDSIQIIFVSGFMASTTDWEGR